MTMTAVSQAVPFLLASGTGIPRTGAGLRLAGLVMAGANSGPRLLGRRDR